jgi:hypothetical protein
MTHVRKQREDPIDRYGRPGKTKANSNLLFLHKTESQAAAARIHYYVSVTNNNIP